MTESNNMAQSRERVEPDRRGSIRSSFEADSLQAAMQGARMLVQEQPSLMNFRFLRQLVDGLKPDEKGLKLLSLIE